MSYNSHIEQLERQMVEIPAKLEERLLKETKAEMLGILLEAIDTMQAYNGRTITYCLVDALGGQANEGEDGTITSYSYPKFKRRVKRG